MKEYRIRARFTGSVYADRTYKRKVFTELKEAKRELMKAKEYYGSGCYKAYIDEVVIEERKVTDWQ